MVTLPDDILRQIFSILPQNTVLNCRLLSQASSYLATSLAFRHVRLETFCDALPFVHISESPRLCPLVREISIDAWQGSLPDEERSQIVLRVTRFLLALPRMGVFSGLQAVNIKFTAQVETQIRLNGQAAMSVLDLRQHQSFQTNVLGTIIKCITGQWTEECHEAWGRSWLAWSATRTSLYKPSGETNAMPGGRFTEFLLPFSPCGRLLSLSALTVANLPDTSDHVFYESPEFQHLLSSQSLSKLKLLVATQRHPSNPTEEIFLPDKYDFFEQLPTTLLSPAIASNLRVLSLYCHDYFGWAPKLDFRLLNPGNGSFPLPSLRVLALGKYVISHDWQVEWIASLGAENGRGGLEELYLDDCPIMWRAHVLGPMDESVLHINGVRIDNCGYPLKDVMTRRSPHDEHWDPVTVRFHLRWSTVLRIWRERMKALKVFRMGSGDWEGENTIAVATARTMDLVGDLESRIAAQPAWRRRCEDVVHLDYDKPSMAECLQHEDSNSVVQHGLGLSQRRECVLQYVHFHVGVGWVERDFKGDVMEQYEDGWQRYEASRSLDEEALRELSDAVAARSHG